MVYCSSCCCSLHSYVDEISCDPLNSYGINHCCFYLGTGHWLKSRETLDESKSQQQQSIPIVVPQREIWGGLNSIQVHASSESLWQTEAALSLHLPVSVSKLFLELVIKQ
ncbi:hypothetical protein H5410_033467 [Solanum commersonii]|uniref:Uncharacterized protein n=1 Tax=Solanum commersonii TaxID=4109 RepID=A0A9J5YNS3_SOLCO|nr:hypothetical protein H5410_033467 [Solanum commersonii]